MAASIRGTPGNPGPKPLPLAAIKSLLSAMMLPRSEEHTSELQSHLNLVCRLLLEKKKTEFLRFEPDQPRGVPGSCLELAARLVAQNVLVISAAPGVARTSAPIGKLGDPAAPQHLHA